MSQALYRKWRPRLWDQVVGQEHIVHTLQNAVRAGRVAHAYLFAGPRGTGKTTTARLLAKAVNCLAEDLSDRPCDHCEHCLAVNEARFLDLIEIDAASNTSVDDVRDLRDKINFSPSQGRFKVYIIDEVHMLSGAAFNALLKTLEEPPAHAIFILATTEVHKIPATVLSRCQRHEFRRIPLAQIVDLLKHLCAEEKLHVEDEVLTLIARQSTGCMRDAISLLDQLASSGELVTLETAQTVLGTATSQAVIDLAEAILQRQTANGLNCIHHALDGGSDARQFARQAVEYLRSLLLLRMGGIETLDAPAELRARMAEHARGFEVPHLLETIRLFNSAASDVRSGWQPSLLLELAFAEAVEFTAAVVVPPVKVSQ
ncbi:MAG TPA: DNA polymerase III subunit gamma/tau, partial [Anaerolineaceae bacterium]|nr:DNA polymerase III subunit gamma/tau [Anaerolineaceae bacterium]